MKLNDLVNRLIFVVQDYQIFCNVKKIYLINTRVMKIKRVKKLYSNILLIAIFNRITTTNKLNLPLTIYRLKCKLKN